MRVLRIASVFLLVFLSGCYTAQVLTGKRFVASDGKTQMLVKNTEDECTIELTGEITATTASLFRNAVAEVESRTCNEKWVILSSGGGVVGVAMEIGRIVRAKGFSTQIHHGNSCASACGMIFIAGANRAISSSVLPTRLGFHQMSKRSFSDKTCVADANNVASKALLAYSKLMLPGRSAEIFYNRVMETDCNKMTYIASDEARSEGIATASKRTCERCTLIN